MDQDGRSSPGDLPSPLKTIQGWNQGKSDIGPKFRMHPDCRLSLGDVLMNKMLSFPAGSNQIFMKDSAQGLFFRASGNEYKKSCATIKTEEKVYFPSGF